MELSEEYILSQYQELGILNGNDQVMIVRHAVTGKIAVKKYMHIEQKVIYAFLKSHRNDFIPQIYDYFEDDRRLIVIEEYIEGRNLEDILCEQKIPVEEGVRIIREVCCALYPLHTANPVIVCRDLKPENIMLTSQGRVKLIDFDIARVVDPMKNRDTVVMGTEGFAAPEQFGRRQTDNRSDIYAMGTLLNYIILQKFPVEQILDGRLGEVVRRSIAVNPDERYQSVKEFEEALEEAYPLKKKAGKETDLPAKMPGMTGWRRFLPPGFRSGRIWKILLAVTGYLLLIDVCFTVEIKEENVVITGVRALAQQILILLSQLAEVGIVFNYLGCRDRIPVLNSRNILVRVTGYIILDFLFLVLAVLIWVLLDLLIFHSS